jgi:uncharacterized protein (DUF342 family)
MPYYVRHFFDPDFTHEKLKPNVLKDGNVDMHYLGYVQNVIPGQVLAEVLNLDEHPDLDNYNPRFIFPERVFPCGPNCEPHPDFPSRILARTSGYVFYHNGLITVKHLLNVRRDVDFHTGHIIFTGDIVAHGNVRSGFAMQGDNLLVKGVVEGAELIAEGDIACEAGLKGGNLRCGGNVKLAFCENARVHAGGNLEIEGSCLHSEIFADGGVLIKGRLQGGKIHAGNLVYVKEQIGSENAFTKVTLGYDPSLYYQLSLLEGELTGLEQRLAHMEHLVQRKPELLDAYDLTLRLLKEKIDISTHKREELHNGFQEGSFSAARCRLVCPGLVAPGLELDIAGEHVEILEERGGVEFYLENNEIVCQAIAK